MQLISVGRSGGAMSCSSLQLTEGLRWLRFRMGAQCYFGRICGTTASSVIATPGCSPLRLTKMYRCKRYCQHLHLGKNFSCRSRCKPGKSCKIFNAVWPLQSQLKPGTSGDAPRGARDSILRSTTIIAFVRWWWTMLSNGSGIQNALINGGFLHGSF